MRKEEIKYLACFLYCSLGPISWFANISLGSIKRLLLVLIVLTFSSYFAPSRLPKLPIFLFLLLFVFLNGFLTDTFDAIITLFFGIIENYLFFVIGKKTNILQLNNKNVYASFSLTALACLLTITNFFIQIPDWVSPNELMLEEKVSAFNQTYFYSSLWQTGFSWGRNGWGCALAVVFPICFLAEKKKYIRNSAIVFIFFSMFLCGCRNGLLAILVSIALYYWFYIRSGKNTQLILYLLYLSIPIIAIGFWEFISTNLRLDSDDLSANRTEQYILIPEMLSQTVLWGNGDGWTRVFLEKHNLPFLLHNTYFKIMIEYGYVPGLILWAIAFKAFKLSWVNLKSHCKENVILASVIISGLMVAMFEPQNTFGTFGFPLWWLAFGILSNKRLYNHERFS